jgi:AcrR family transcriptional regulator
MTRKANGSFPENRDRILDAADQALATVGYRRMRIEDLAQAAGIAKGTVYLSFDSKAEIALACIDRMAAHVFERMQAIAVGSGSVAQRLERALVERVMVRLDYARGHATSVDEILSAIRPEVLARRSTHFEAEAAVLTEMLRGVSNAREKASAMIDATNALLPYSLSVREMGRRAEVARRAERLAHLVVRGALTPTRRSSPMKRILIALAALAWAVPASAQFASPKFDQPDMTVDPSTKKAVVDSLADRIEERYVFADVAKTVAKELRARSKKGRYDSITSAKAFNDSLNADLRALAHDLHLRTHYRSEPFPVVDPNSRVPTPEERAQSLADSRRINFGFLKVERMPGNVGYVELVQFDGSAEGGAVAQTAMEFLKYTDALIFDLRRNGGGDPNMAVLLLSHLFGEDDRVHINDFFTRTDPVMPQYWTLTTLPGPRFLDKPVYVLTSKHTGSCAEEFAYDIQQLKRGTLVGETTAGGANPGSMVRLNANFAAFIADGRAVNPVSKANWEGVGVKPDVPVPADDALSTAHVQAIEGLIAKATDADRKAALGRALAQAKGARPS